MKRGNFKKKMKKFMVTQKVSKFTNFIAKKKNKILTVKKHFANARLKIRE